MAHEFYLRRRVEFAETDMAGIVHFANFFRYMEQAEHAFLRSLGYTVHPHETTEYSGWPRVHANCDFKTPVRFEDELQVHLQVIRKGTKSLSYRFTISRCEDGVPVAVAAIGNLVCVCMLKDPQSGEMRGMAIPDGLANKIEVAPEAVKG
ncbi:MAG: acyl-CoA thioesterase [Calditrichia bacterium]